MLMYHNASQANNLQKSVSKKQIKTKEEGKNKIPYPSYYYIVLQT